jgi:uncharacterized protein (TIGR03000 family)
VLLTDTPALRVVPELLPALPPQSGSGDLSRLFFANRGLVDVQAAAAGETAFPRDGEGGLFTLALVDALRDIKPDADPSWPALIDRVKATTDRLYVEYRRAVLASNKVSSDDKRVYREQDHQTPAILSPLNRVEPAPQPIAPQAAEIVVRLPAAAKVFVEDRPTKLTGPERRFETAALKPGKMYTYEIKVETDRDGKTVSQIKRVSVKAGESVSVKFE